MQTSMVSDVNKNTVNRSPVNAQTKTVIKPMKNAVLIVLGLAVGTAAAMAQTGNGAPSGSHYNLNILGKRDCTPADLTGSNRHTIQVLLNGGQSANDINGTLALTLDRK